MEAELIAGGLAAFGIVAGGVGFIAGTLRIGQRASMWQRKYLKAEFSRLSLANEKARRDAPLKAANIKRHYLKLQREAAEAHATQVLHDQMAKDIAACRLGEAA